MSSSLSSSSSSVGCRHFSLEEIKVATNNFDEKKVLGSGGEGKVYRGYIPVGRDEELFLVAVKRLSRKRNSIEFEKEIMNFSKIQHPNLVSLLGYCNELNENIAVYEYMENGSLSDYVTKNSICLSWTQRLKICLGAARGMQHLHTPTDGLPKGIIHADMKAANILLDKNWVAKVSDFGLAKLSHPDQTNSTMPTDNLKGTRGYYAPEYLKTNKVTRKIDVYSFGMVLFEVLCRKKRWYREDDKSTHDEDIGEWARQNVDTKISEKITGDSLTKFVDIIKKCLQEERSDRPTMDEVVLDLEGALKSHEHERDNTRVTYQGYEIGVSTAPVAPASVSQPAAASPTPVIGNVATFGPSSVSAHISLGPSAPISLSFIQGQLLQVRSQIALLQTLESQYTSWLGIYSGQIGGDPSVPHFPAHVPGPAPDQPVSTATSEEAAARKE